MRLRRLALGVWLVGLAFCVWQVMQVRFVADKRHAAGKAVLGEAGNELGGGLPGADDHE